jgi:predicted acetyltransferase
MAIADIFKTNKLSDFDNYEFKEFEELFNGEIRIKLSAVYGVNKEKDFVPRYVFDIILEKSNENMGFIVLRAGLTDNLLIRGGHIGYEIKENYRGNNYISKALKLLKPFLKEIHFDKILITCDEDNIASRKSIEKIKGKLIEINHHNNCCYYVLDLLN